MLINPAMILVPDSDLVLFKQWTVRVLGLPFDVGALPLTVITQYESVSTTNLHLVGPPPSSRPLFPDEFPPVSSAQTDGQVEYWCCEIQLR